ncbi:MAG: protein GlmU [Desulfobacterales bacterium]|nr:protein GlmU [Desulfobacterales bacterium]
MELKPKAYDKIVQLVQKGVDIPNPITLDIGEEVKVEHISGKGVRIYPGCRIYGKQTVIASGAQLGREGPVTVEDCEIGPKVELKGGYFKKSVFLEKANMGFGAHVREGCILEEEAGGAHCVGLKQTILFPFVTLGSLINFCDCLMAGGTSRKDHSEVGSSYIHFNFTPTGDKTTASLIGDVPRGVMLNQPAIFLGGQGGIVGPLRLGYGNVIAAGTVLRQDITDENKLIIGKPQRSGVVPRTPNAYFSLSRIVQNNYLYLSNLSALEAWYTDVRKGFFDGQEFGDLIYAGLLEKVGLAREERIKRLKAMSEKMPIPDANAGSKENVFSGKREFAEHVDQACALFSNRSGTDAGADHRDRFLSAFGEHKRNHGGSYIEVVKSLPADISQAGTLWLENIVRGLSAQVGALFPSLDLFRK